MRINIVCSQPAWIYGTFIENLKRYSSHEIRLNENELACELVHFLPYYEVPDSLPSGLKYTAFFSHQEVDHIDQSLSQKFISASKLVDTSICMAKRYVSVLEEAGAKKIVQIIPGVDSSFFCRTSVSQSRKSSNDKLVVGFVGKLYDTTNRKNSELLLKISELPFVDFRVTLGKVPLAELPQFYSELDLVVSPSTVEGGPMCILEALSIGVPVLCFSGVGFGDEFGHGVLKVPQCGDPLSDEVAFLERLRLFQFGGEKEQFQGAEMRGAMQQQIQPHTWERFANLHDQVWNAL